MNVLVLREAGFTGDVAEVGVVRHRRDARGQIGVDRGRERERPAIGGGHRDDMFAVERARVAKRRTWGKRRANDRDRMMKKLRPSIPRDWCRCAGRIPVCGDGIRHIRIEPEYLALRRRSLEVAEVRRPRLFHPETFAGDVDQASIASNRERLRRRFRRHILPEVAVGTLAFDRQRSDREDPIATAERLGGVVDDLLVRGARRAAGGNRQGREQASGS